VPFNHNLILFRLCTFFPSFSWFHDVEHLSFNPVFFMTSSWCRDRWSEHLGGTLCCGKGLGKNSARCHQKGLQESIPGSSMLQVLEEYLWAGLSISSWRLLGDYDLGCSCQTEFARWKALPALTVVCCTDLEAAYISLLGCSKQVWKSMVCQIPLPGLLSAGNSLSLSAGGEAQSCP